jgi:hypothetical protein
MESMRSRARALLARWEALSAGQQLRRSYVTSVVVLLVFHLALVAAFHRITVPRAISYAIFESIVVAGLVTIATQGELARRRDAEQARRSAGPDSADDAD